MPVMTERVFAALFDHTLLKASARRSDFEKICFEAEQYGFKMVAVNSAQVRLCKALLGSAPVHVGAAVSFPLGQTTLGTKLFETETAIKAGADEIDYVVNLSELKNGNWDYVRREMSEIADLCRRHEVISKVIFENCYLEKWEIDRLSKLAREIKPDFIKTSTGFGPGGATEEDVRRMKQTVGEEVQVKAAGGIRTLETCLKLIRAGATRIGSSASVSILNEFIAAGE